MKLAKRPKTITEYIKMYPKAVATRLRAIREIINKEAPEAVEITSYGMPAFKLNGILIYFAAYEHHIGVYPYPSTMSAFAKELVKYKTGRSTIQFPHDRPLPLPLIRKVVKFRVKEKSFTICSRGHKFNKTSAHPVCPKCWPGRYRKK